ncbi:MAG TPA: NAD-dependent succinate-semialdehyde dehydrogenase [Burkholderiales bacterium]|nr:NAD-dependent succinate-semialdehyde dehydrogenase [Burkholderiales bacterium]
MIPTLKNPQLFRQQGYVAGRWIDADEGKTIDVTDPAKEKVLGTVPNMGAAETRRAIEAANAAWPAWRAKSAKERAVVLRAWYELMLANKEDLAIIMTLEQGKPLIESRGEINYAAAFLEWFAEEAKRVYGETIPATQGNRRIVVTKEPVGVACAITPWNFPAAMITRKVGPALAAGCPMIVKPASATPFSALALAELAERAGVPAGVFSVVTGGAKEIGAEMTANPLVRKFSFTGSTATGKLLLEQCASTVKKTSMELGGNAPFIVFDDADLDAAADGALASKFRNAGQTCVCANRILVHESIYDAFAAKFKQRVEAIKVGNGLEEGVHMGPLVDENALKKAEEHIADALSHGARVLLGGKRHALGGLFFEPTILLDVDTRAKVSKEETFGPVAPLYKFKTEDEAIKMANDTEFGLAAYFYTRDLARSWRVSEALEYGMVGVNAGLISTEVAPFGGVKESGLGREGARQGIEEYLELKYVGINI